MSVLLEMTQSFIEMIDTDMSKKGSIRKKTLSELVESYIDYHLENGNLLKPDTVVDYLVTTTICLGMVLAMAREMRKLGHPMRASAADDITYHLRSDDITYHLRSTLVNIVQYHEDLEETEAGSNEEK